MSEFEQKAPSTVNPLSAFFRQPKIFMSLPSNGDFYPAGVLEPTVNNEYPVYAMTARDELLFKTPDALMNGAATVEVIKSCVPNIKDPWHVPSLDVDAILCAIRIATYGVEMDVQTTCPKCATVNDAVVDLRTVLDNLNKIQFNKSVEIDNTMLVHLKPMNYEQITKTALKAFEHQRIFSIINDENMKEEDKIRLFQESFVKLTDLTIDTAVSCIDRIESTGGTTNNPVFIKEFLSKADKNIFKTINDAINKTQESGTLSSFHSNCQNCQHEWNVSLTLDQSDFFEQGFRQQQ
jgi:hypothetical protein